MTSYLDYAHLIDRAMHFVVREALRDVQRQGLFNDHHFFISFDTQYPGVMLSDDLKERFPEEMTIVIQHQFWDLEVEEERFCITLSFNNVKHNLTVPFDALISFADPSVKFGLQFSQAHDLLDDEEAMLLDDLEEENPKPSKKSDGSNVVTLDAFRKK